MRVACFLIAVGLTSSLLATCKDQPRQIFPQPRACRDALAVYFAEDSPLRPDPNNPDDPVRARFRGLFPEDELLVVATFGENGSCWLDDGDELHRLAKSCEDRCKGLLWQDCASPFTTTNAIPDGAACPAGCEGEGEGEGEGEPSQCVCPTSGPACGCAVDACPPGGCVAPLAPTACDDLNALPCRFEDFERNEAGQRNPDVPLFSACPSPGGRCVIFEPLPPLVDNVKPDPIEGCCQLEGRRPVGACESELPDPAP